MGVIGNGPHYIVRGGLVRPDTLIAGTAQHRDVPGLAGFSVQSAPGITVDELACGGQFRNSSISVTTRATLQWYGFKLIFPTPGKGVYHETAQAPYPLPPDLADLLSCLFNQDRNPYPVRYEGQR